MGVSQSQQRIVLERDAYARQMTMDVIMTPDLHSRLTEKQGKYVPQEYQDQPPPYHEHQGHATVAVDLDPSAVTFYKENVNRLIRDAYNQGLRDQETQMISQFEDEKEEQRVTHVEEKLAMRLQLEEQLTSGTEKLTEDLRRTFAPASAIQTDCKVPRQKLMECYREHTKDALACSALIDSFVECSRDAVKAHGTISESATARR